MRLLLGLPTTTTSFARLVALARRAEAAGVHAVTISDPRWPDEPGAGAASIAFEPLTLAAALAVSTSRIGIIATAGLAPVPPYNLARRFASLDVISKGRGGWHLPAGADPRSARTAEYLAVVDGLWRSWDVGALVRDKERGRFFDPGKMRALAHQGEHFAVRGPLNVARSPQGRPVVAVTLRPGDDPGPAARVADLVLVGAEAGGERVDQLDAALIEASHGGRTPLRIASSAIAGPDQLEARLRSGTYGGLHLELEDERQAGALLDGTLAELRRRRVLGDIPAGTTLRASLGLAEPAR